MASARNAFGQKVALFQWFARNLDDGVLLEN
jgi:hypothetical protein